MSSRIGLGPVFTYDRLIAARRWQTYAARALFVAALLAALAVVYLGTLDGLDRRSFRHLGRVGMNLFYGLMGTQLVLVLLAAPAATAGAFCLDRARGTLAHLLTTDLSNTEIVLGRLTARLLPVLGLVASTLPVLMITGLLGGIDPNALIGAELITVGLAVLGCSLALAFSLWARRTHEALLGAYSIWVVWLLAEPITRLLATYGLPWTFPREADPFHLAFAPYLRPGRTSLAEPLIFLAAMLGLSIPLVVLLAAQIRRVGAREQATRRRLRRARSWRLRLPGPSLDFNPVLWREWHRSRPAGWTRLVVGLYIVLAGASSAIVASQLGSSGRFGNLLAWVNALQVSVGYLFLSVGAASSLAEERARGSLDLLMSTPLSTREIVAGKWLGAFRLVPAVAALPFMLGCSGALMSGHWPPLVTLAAYLVACGAMITSLALAVATWVPRVGRAVGLTVTCYVLLTVGWVFACEAIGRPSPNSEGVAMASPFMASGALSFAISVPGRREVGWGVFWTLFHAGLAAVLLGATLRTFNRCLGRAEGRPRAGAHRVMPAGAWDREMRPLVEDPG